MEKIYASTSQFPLVPSAAIACMILDEALDADSEVYVYSPAMRTPDSIREFVIEYLRKNIGKDSAKLSNVTLYLHEVWRSIFLEVQDLLRPSEADRPATTISRIGELRDDEYEVELLSNSQDSKEIRIRKKLISATDVPSDREIYF